MANYLPGQAGQDYVPQIQPFSPDLNFYANVLTQKEGQYAKGQEKVNSIYGQMLNSEMLREPDNKKREDFFQNVDREIKRLSGVDLSLEENVDSAYKIFDPLLNDRNIMNDMAWTKNYRNEKKRGENFRNCKTEADCGGKWWPEGDKYLDYKAEEFSKSDDNAALSMRKVKYTPFTNIYTRVNDMFKKEGIDMSTARLGKDGFIHTDKFGVDSELALGHYAVASMMNEPSVKDMVNVQSYNDRQDYIRSHSKFDGDELRAEKEYLINKQKYISDYNLQLNTEVKKVSDITSLKKDIISKKHPKVEPTFQKSIIEQLLSLNEVKATADKAGEHYSQAQDAVSPENNLGANIESLRESIDGSWAATMLSQQAHDAANSFAALHHTEKLEANPFALKAVEFDYNKRLKAIEEDYHMTNEDQRFRDEMQLEAIKKGHTLNKIEQPRTYLDPSEATTAAVPMIEHNATIQNNFSTDANINYKDYIDKFKADILAGMKSDDSKHVEYSTKIYNNVFGPQSIGNKKTLGYGKDDLGSMFVGHPGTAEEVYKHIQSIVKTDKQVLDIINNGSVLELNRIQKKADDYKEASDILSKKQDNNYKLITDYIRGQHTNDYSDDAPLMMTNGIYNPGYFITAYKAKHPEATFDDAVKAKNVISKDMAEHYNSNIIPEVQSFDKAAFNTSGGGAIQSNTMHTREDALTQTDNWANTHESLKLDAELPESKIVSGSIGDSKGSPSGLTTDERAKNILELYFKEYGEDSYKLSDSHRPVADIFHSAVALDKDWEATTYVINPEFLKKFAGTSKTPGLTAGYLNSDGTFNNKITVFTPISKARNLLHDSEKYTSADILVDQPGGYDINTYRDGGGKIHLERDNNGNITGSKEIQYLDDKGEIQYQSQAIEPHSGVNAREFIETANRVLAQQRLDNKIILQDFINRSNKKITIAQIEEYYKSNPQALQKREQQAQ